MYVQNICDMTYASIYMVDVQRVYARPLHTMYK